MVVYIERFEPKIEHPGRIMLATGNIADDILCQALLRLIKRPVLIFYIIERTLYIFDKGLFLLHDIHLTLRPAHQGYA